MSFYLVFRDSIKSILLATIFTSIFSCGGDANSENNSTEGLKEEPPTPTLDSELLSIEKENADDIARHLNNTTSMFMKFSLLLQAGFDDFVISKSDSSIYKCRSGGDIIFSLEDNSTISAKFEQCYDDAWGEKFDGKLVITPKDIRSNLGNEVYLSADVVIEETILPNMVNENYSSISGGFSIEMESTYYGDVITLKSHPNELIKITDDNGSDSSENFTIQFDYDHDIGELNITSTFSASFDISITSSELNGTFDCKTNKTITVNREARFVVNRGDIKELDITCKGSTANVLQLELYEDSGPAQYIVNSISNEREKIGTTNFSHFLSLLQYQPEGSPAAATFQLPVIDSVDFDMPINDAVYSSLTGYYYLAVSSAATGTHASNLIEVDISSGEITRSVPLKGEAATLAISPDGTVLYLGYKTYSEVQRVEIENMQLTTTIALVDPEPYLPKTLFPDDIAVSPASNDIIAVAPWYVRGSQIPHSSWSTRFYKSGVEHSVITGDYNFQAKGNRVVFNRTGDRLITYQGDVTSHNLSTYEVKESGPEHLVTRQGFVQASSELNLIGDELFHADGSVINLETGEIMGKYNTIYTELYQWLPNRAAIVSPDEKLTLIYNNYLEIFDKERFTYISAVDLKLEGEFINLFNISDTEFVVVGKQGIKQFNYSDLPTYPDKTCEEIDAFGLKVTIDIQAIHCAVNGAAYSALHNKLYLSISSTFGKNGNTIAVLNAKTLEVEKYLNVGPEPTELEISVNQTYLYVAHHDLNKVSVIELATNNIINYIELGNKLLQDNRPDYEYHDDALASHPLFSVDIEPSKNDDESILIFMRTLGWGAEMNSLDYTTAATYTNGLRYDENTENYYSFFDDGYRSNQTDSKSKEVINKLSELNFNVSINDFVIDNPNNLLYVYESYNYGQDYSSEAKDPVIKVFDLQTYEQKNNIYLPTFSVFRAEVKKILNLESKILIVLENYVYAIDKDEML